MRYPSFTESERAKPRPQAELNPYAPPQTTGRAQSEEAAETHRDSTEIAAGFLAASVALALAYTYCDEILIGTRYGAWPLLFGAAAISLVCAVWTRSWLLAPLCCFAGTISGDLLAAVVRDWAYAQFHYCVPLAIGFSLPSLVVAWVLGRWRPRRVP